MKKAETSKKDKPVPDVVEKQQQQPRKSPVELDIADLKQVSGGLPRGSWKKTSE
jgi:hypothetical protein